MVRDHDKRIVLHATDADRRAHAEEFLEWESVMHRGGGIEEWAEFGAYLNDVVGIEPAVESAPAVEERPRMFRR